jgi:hypothetical protein
VISLANVKKSQDSNFDKLFDLTSFLAVSARGTIEEGVFCGSLRLVEAIKRTINLLPDATQDPFLDEISTIITTQSSKSYLESEEKYRAFLDGLVVRFADEIMRRNGLVVPKLPKKNESAGRKGIVSQN